MLGSMLFVLFCCIAEVVNAGSIKGIIVDQQTKEPLIGVSLQIVGTTTGTSTDLDGHYELKNIKEGSCELEIRYLSYKTIRYKLENLLKGEVRNLDFEMETDEQLLGEVVVVARKDLENSLTLLSERKAAAIALENIGAKEMAAKGISNAEDGVKKMTGISFVDVGHLIVRGLGDRYSITTLNGLPIASPNPDNKLIPLDLFPSSTIRNITVKKVYEVGAFADYSGAHIDIGTRENSDENFLKVSLNIGGNINTILRDFRQSDKKYGLWKINNLDNDVLSLSASQFSEHIKTTDPFGTSFAISEHKALPDFSGNISFSRSIDIDNNNLGIISAISMGHGSQTMNDAYQATLTAQGTKLNEFTSDSYSSQLDIGALMGIGYRFKTSDYINYTMFYSRNATDNYKLRNGYDSEGVHLIGSNCVAHAYSLLNNQLSGKHSLGKRWGLRWSGSYGITGSDEPDRRQVMYREEEGILKLFKLNQQETMRYFGTLREQELVGDIRAKYNFKEGYYLHIGTTFKQKGREYHSTRFYYNIAGINPHLNSVDEVFSPSEYINQNNIENGILSVLKDAQPKSSYYAGSTIMAAFAEANLLPSKYFQINAGLRIEQSNQWVNYWTDGSIEKLSLLEKFDFFPAIHFKYNINEANNLKLSLSRTVTRPGFIEMAPFLYKESFGSDEVRGNENLKNGYNINLDLRYDLIPATNNGDMLSVGGYYKILKNPIERVQESSGGSAVHSFRNAENGMAAGLELELHKTLLKNLKIRLNATYIYTNVILPQDGGIYTDQRRPLQGASPYLLNADISYELSINDTQRMRFVMLYNLQGPCIHMVGIYGVGNVIQKAQHNLDFVGQWQINESWSAQIKINDLLNNTVRYVQEVKTIGEVIEVGRYRKGMNISLGISFKI